MCQSCTQNNNLLQTLVYKRKYGLHTEQSHDRWKYTNTRFKQNFENDHLMKKARNFNLKCWIWSSELRHIASHTHFLQKLVLNTFRQDWILTTTRRQAMITEWVPCTAEYQAWSYLCCLNCSAFLMLVGDLDDWLLPEVFPEYPMRQILHILQLHHGVPSSSTCI